MASAAGPASSSLLLQYLTLTGWSVDIRDDGDACSGVAVRDKTRVTAWAKTRAAAAILFFEHACGAPPPHGRAPLS